MNLLSEAQAEAWCVARGLAVKSPLPASKLTYGGGVEQRIRILVSGLPVEVVTMAYVLLMSSVPEDDERRFAGGMLWLQDWDIWSETTERVGLLLLRGLRRYAELDCPIKERPAELFAGSEFAESQTSLVLPLMFQWDAYFVPESGGCFFYTSHHGHVDVVTQDKVQHKALLKRFEEAGLHPAVPATP